MTSKHDGFERRQLDVNIYNLDGLRVLALSGECDFATRDELERGLDEALAGQPTALIVDLSRLTFCDGRSAALVLLAAQASPLAVAGTNIPELPVFDVLDPDAEVPRYPTVDNAANDLSEHLQVPENRAGLEDTN